MEDAHRLVPERVTLRACLLSTRSACSEASLDRRALVALAGRAEVDRALCTGEIGWVSRGLYTLPEADESVRVASGSAGCCR